MYSITCVIINIITIITTFLILFVLSLTLLNSLTISGWLDRWDESISINAVYYDDTDDDR